jgi:hypothetical protein
MPAKPKKSKSGGAARPAASPCSPGERGPRLYTLNVAIMNHPIGRKFVKKRRKVVRTIQIRGDQTLEDLHEVIFAAFDRFDPHMYEFQFGKGPMDPQAVRYVMPEALESHSVFGDEDEPADTVDKTSLDSLGLNPGKMFGYWFDFGDDWWHQIDVEAVEDSVPGGDYPRIVKRIGESPPQYEES